MSTGELARKESAKTPAVVFVDHTRWGTFTQLAAFVRRSGFRAVRVTLARDAWYHRLIDRLIYNRSIHVDESDLANFGELVRDELVADVQCTEYVCSPLAHGDLSGLDADVSESLRARGVLLDKFVVGELAQQRGVQTPEKLAADAVPPENAAHQLGFPLVVKAKVGASGDRVRIVKNEQEFAQALQDLGPDMSELFFERFIEGECIDYSAIVGPSGLIQEVVTRTIAAGDGTLPPSEIEIVDDPALIAFGRHAVEKLEVAGIAHMDTVRDSEGNYWLLDLNLRAWGSMFSCKRAGVDFGTGYLYSIGLNRQEPATRTGSPGIVKVFPSVVEEQIHVGRIVGTCAAFARHSPVFIKWLGIRYWIAQLASTAVSLAGQRASQRQRRGKQA